MQITVVEDGELIHGGIVTPKVAVVFDDFFHLSIGIAAFNGLFLHCFKRLRGVIDGANL